MGTNNCLILHNSSKYLLLCHEGDPCLRSSDCSEGYCCARHFWTKICKPVLRQGEVCTKQRKKGSHSLEIFQRCDCAKGLACECVPEQGGFGMGMN
uniref:Dickkopf N-terminal cysteine-rich domain-containing protein n=1 Tax=Sinocyclocheilus grahami TaxID=75366 RepID=A0A672KQ30_SINGR